ncbi:ahpC/TSA antioxidant enzyme [Hirsutella rhossiliensis]|uniref:AhpC/TSA antioxidant enzyme domain-containing protein n=1 Tax=Hirsutella rhossiliensis TaxID=111463 RepID=A0A9P8SEG3_9HYPO|nr:ahpC/TSA antioxidant enzyme domain-containing protein [Hirsutella rhossiliensis]KAH0959641.1 ahpC/TSA antioxidant enzyme domain-containing protein [Hirsutella rhossiliensis]
MADPRENGAAKLTSPETDRPNDASAAAPRRESDEKKPGSSAGNSHAPSTAVDQSKPADFEGELSTTNELPSPETISKIDNYVVLDRDGRTHTFQSLYSGRNAARRVLVLFVRHFFCGNCQEYLRSLSASVTPEALLRLPISTFVVVIGCGNPSLIDMYVETTKCPFPVYTDPTASLFNELGMVKTLALGPKPEYMRRPMIRGVVESIGQALRSVPSGMALKSGDHRQVGGEFLFEPVDVVTPVVTPLDEIPNPMGPSYGGRGDENNGPIEPKRVTWCHRMKSTRDHAEIPEVMEILGLQSQIPASSISDKDKKRWAEAGQVRRAPGAVWPPR